MGLKELQDQGEAPLWLDQAGYTTLSNGYLLENETPAGMYKRVAKAAASYYKDPTLEQRFFDIIWNNWLS